jgi:hypothetical protein
LFHLSTKVHEDKQYYQPRIKYEEIPGPEGCLSIPKALGHEEMPSPEGRLSISKMLGQAGMLTEEAAGSGELAGPPPMAGAGASDATVVKPTALKVAVRNVSPVKAIEFATPAAEMAGTDARISKLELGDRDLTNTALAFELSAHADLSNITELTLVGNSRLADLSPIAQCTSLQKLNISETAVRSVRCLEPLKKLQSLRASSLEWEDEASLESSAVRHPPAHIDGLDKLISLEELILTDNAIENIEAITSMTELKVVSLSHCTSLESIKPLISCKKLRRLDLGFSSFPPEELNLLEGLPLLAELDLQGHDYDPSQLMPLQSCPSLQVLRVDSEDIGLARSAEAIVKACKGSSEELSAEPLGEVKRLKPGDCTR